jgi:uncharacterized protein YdbL (DUF1318 family)
VDALSGDYDTLTKKINKARAEELKKLKTSNSAAISATNKVFSDNLREGKGHKTGGGGYQGTFNSGWSNGDEKAAH